MKNNKILRILGKNNNKSKKHYNNVWKKIFLLIFSIIIIILLLELSNRIYQRLTHGDCLSSNENAGMYETKHVGYYLKKNLAICKYNPKGEKMYFYTNNINTRNKENISIEKPENIKKRIILVGDSMVTGFYTDHEDSYSEKLKKYLGPDYEIITIGASGYDLQREAILLIKYSSNLKPDIIIQNIYFNDYEYDPVIDLTNWDYKLIIGKLDDAKNVYLVLPGIDEIIELNQSELKNNTMEITLSQLDNKVIMYNDLSEYGRMVTEKYNIKKEEDSIIKKSYLYNLLSRFSKKITIPKTQYNDTPYLDFMYHKHENHLTNYSIILNLKLLESIDMYGKINNISVIFVNLPGRMQTDDAYFEKISQNMILPENEPIDKEAINKIQREFMQYHNYNYLDLSPYLINITDIYYDEMDEHLNSKGNDLLASKLAEYLIANNLV